MKTVKAGGLTEVHDEYEILQPWYIFQMYVDVYHTKVREKLL